MKAPSKAEPAATWAAPEGRTGNAGDLADSKWSQVTGTYPEIVQIVTIGEPKDRMKMSGSPNGMRACVGINFTDDQVHEAAAYAYTLSHH